MINFSQKIRHLLHKAAILAFMLINFGCHYDRDQNSNLSPFESEGVLELFKKAESGDLNSQFAVDTHSLPLMGNTYGEKLDWLQTEYKKNNPHPRALAYAGLYLVSDYRGISVNKELSYGLIKKSANLDDAYGQMLMGMHFQAVEKDFKSAIGWYEKSYAKGHDMATLNLGIIYLHGKGGYKDLTKAKYYLTKASQSKLNNVRLQSELILQNLN